MRRSSFCISSDLWREMLVKKEMGLEFQLDNTSPISSNDDSSNEDEDHRTDNLNVDSFEEIDDNKAIGN